MKKYLDEYNRPVGMSERKKNSSFMLPNFEKRVFSGEQHSEILLIILHEDTVEHLFVSLVGSFNDKTPVRKDDERY
jgi:hypothetical protein